MSRLAAKKCVRHPAREAAGRCSACGNDFCRECIGDHGGVLLCGACLAAQTATSAPASRAGRGRSLARAAVTIASAIVLWFAFYGFGQFLKVLPPELHEGTIWRDIYK